eukprot:s47_g69.t1
MPSAKWHHRAFNIRQTSGTPGRTRGPGEVTRHQHRKQHSLVQHGSHGSGRSEMITAATILPLQSCLRSVLSAKELEQSAALLSLASKFKHMDHCISLVLLRSTAMKPVWALLGLLVIGCFCSRQTSTLCDGVPNKLIAGFKAKSVFSAHVAVLAHASEII